MTNSDLVWLCLPAVLLVILAAAHAIAWLAMHYLERTPYSVPWYIQVRFRLLNTVMKPICRVFGHRPPKNGRKLIERSTSLRLWICPRCRSVVQEAATEPKTNTEQKGETRVLA